MSGQTTQTPAALSQFSFRNFADTGEQSRSFDRLVASNNTNLTLTGDREAQLLRGTVVTADLFPLSGVSSARGRTFLAEEDRAGGGPGGRPAILSWEVWREHFGGDAGVVGRAIHLNDSRFTIVEEMRALGYFVRVARGRHDATSRQAATRCGTRSRRIRCDVPIIAPQ